MIRLCVLFIFILGLASSAGAQNVQRAAAVVNDEIISTHDLDSRTKLMIFSAQLADTPETREKIRNQVLRALIDERLKLQEANRLKVKASKREIARALTEIEEQNKLPKGQIGEYLASRGIPIETLRRQIEANVAWSKVILLRLRPRITISSDEVTEFLDQLKSRQGQTEYRLAEILLRVENDADAPQVRRTAMRLIEQINGGAPFSAVARQFSQSATAAVGGDLGWVQVDELDPELREIVPALTKGRIHPPIRTTDGYRLIALVDKRRIGAAAAQDIRLDLRQVFLSAPASEAAAPANGLLEKAKSVRARLKSCADAPAVAKDVGSTLPPNLGQMALSDLAPVIRGAVAQLKPGGVSEPVRLPNGVMVLMVCGRHEPKIHLPSEEEIREALLRRRLSLMVRRYMRDIQLAAVIDVRK